MSPKSESPFSARLRLKLIATGMSASQKDARVIQRAFVEALKEEVGARYAEERGPGIIPFDGVPYPNAHKPLVIAGLGSFKMRTRPQRTFDVGYPAEWHGTDENQEPQMNRLPRETVTKLPARRLGFTAKWEEIK